MPPSKTTRRHRWLRILFAPCSRIVSIVQFFFRVVVALAAFRRRHIPFTDALIIGLIASVLLSTIPKIGAWLAPFAMAAAVLSGLIREWREAFASWRKHDDRDD